MQEFYLSDNIVQGEEIPFYILWKGDEIKSLKLELGSLISEREEIEADYNNLLSDVDDPTSLDRPGE